MDNNYLSHDGVKGMKWGERRYQYKDGSLTPEGRIHYGYGDTKTRIKVMKAENRNRIRYERAQTRERIRYEKAKQKMNNKFVREINADRERERNKAIKVEKQQIAEYKRKHPLKYAQIKKYLTKDGTLNDAGRVRFFGNGDKKTINRMSTDELIEAKNRFDAEENYKYVTNRIKNGKASNKFLKTIFQAGATFASVYAGRRIANKVSKGKMYAEESDTIKAAIAAMSGVLLANLGIRGVKTGNPFNDDNKKGKKDKNGKKWYETNDYIDNDGFRYYNQPDGSNVRVPLDENDTNNRRR